MKSRSVTLSRVTSMTANPTPPVAEEMPDYVKGQVHFCQNYASAFMDRESARCSIVWLANALQSSQQRAEQLDKALDIWRQRDRICKNDLLAIGAGISDVAEILRSEEHTMIPDQLEVWATALIAMARSTQRTEK